MSKTKKLVKSDVEQEDQFEIDEKLVDEVADSAEFADVEISNEDIMDALAAIDALAEAVLEKADAEQKELDADMLLDEVRDMIDDVHEDEEEELAEEEMLPEELTNAAVRVMVSEDGAVDLESTPDEVYDSDIDGLGCTVYDTVNLPPIDVVEEGNPENDDVLVIGNSKASSFKKGFVTITNSVSKKAWSAAFQRVKKLVKSGKLTAAHWALVSALAKEEEEKDKLKKKLECALIKKIRSSANYKKRLVKSSDEFDDLGQPISETKPEETVGVGNPDYQEEEKPTDAVSPEEVTSESGNPTEDPDKMVENNKVPVVEEENVELEVFLANSKRKVNLKKVLTNAKKGYSAYKVTNLDRSLYSALDGKVVKSGKNAYLFKDTANGLLACAAQYVEAGKGKYTTVIKNDRVVITRGNEAKIFNNVERVMNFRAIVNSKKASGRKPVISSRRTIEARKQELINAHRKEVLANRMARKPIVSKAVSNARKEVVEARREVIRSKMEARRELQKAKLLASCNEAKLRAMHDNEERERLFQASQNVINEEKIAIKQGMSRNSSALDKMYNGLF